MTNVTTTRQLWFGWGNANVHEISAGSPYTVNLVPDPYFGQVEIVKDLGATADIYPITVNGNGHTIDDGVSYLLASKSGCVSFYYNGTQWDTTADYRSTINVGTEVTGVLSVLHGGTGSFAASSALSNLLGNPATGYYSLYCANSSNASPQLGTPDFSVTFTNITIGNATETAHGFCPALSGSAVQFLNGEGNWITIATDSTNGYLATPFASQTSVTVTHNFGAYPVVQVINGSDAVITPASIAHNSINEFVVTFSSPTSGTILSTVGTPQVSSYITTDSDYVITENDFYIEVTQPLVTVTLPTAVGKLGKEYNIDNSSLGDVFIYTTSSQTIQSETSQTVPENCAIEVVSNGSNWRIK